MATRPDVVVATTFLLKYPGENIFASMFFVHDLLAPCPPANTIALLLLKELFLISFFVLMRFLRCWEPPRAGHFFVFLFSEKPPRAWKSLSFLFLFFLYRYDDR